jgi:hypothetical protein
MEELFDKTVDVWRLNDESPDVEEYQLHLSDITCNIQPLEDSYGEDLQGSYGKDFVMFCLDHDIQEKDKIIDGLLEYLVVGVERYDFLGYEHMEMRIRLVPTVSES